MVINRGFFYLTKKRKKLTINSNFTEFSRTHQWSESFDQHRKMLLEGLEFFSILGFFKTDFTKSYCESEKGRVAFL